MSKYKSFGRFEAVWNIHGGEDGIDRLLRGETMVAERKQLWTEHDCVFSLTLSPTQGASGYNWKTDILGKRFIRMDFHAGEVLCSEKFKPTNNVVYRIKILGWRLFEDSERRTNTITDEALDRGLFYGSSLPIEVAPALCSFLSAEDLRKMGFDCIMAMHKPQEPSGTVPLFLGPNAAPDQYELGSMCPNPDGTWPRKTGFAFLESATTV